MTYAGCGVPAGFSGKNNVVQTLYNRLCEVLKMPVTMRDYANQCGVSYEAIRRQVARYKKDLDGHIEKRGRIQVLDDWAVDFLNARRRGNPVLVAQVDLQEQLRQLQDENKALLIKVAAQADKISGLYGELQEASKAVLQLEAATSAQKKAQEGLEAAQEEITALKAELAAEREKTWFKRLLGR